MKKAFAAGAVMGAVAGFGLCLFLGWLETRADV